MRIERETLTSTANNDSRAAANCIIMLGIIPYFPGKNACPANLDVEPGHNADDPALRRVNAPVEVSEAYYEAMTQSRMAGVADL